MTAGLVVVGASLGGLKAISSLLSTIPADFPGSMAVVQHRRADEESRLCELIGRHSNMPVVEPDDKQVLHPGTVYLSPPDYHLLIDGKALALSIDEPVNFARPSIDVLFQSAAEAEFQTLVGVLLTASSDDGAEGIAAIARAGGTTIVQDPNDAESPTAPKAALSRCRVDHVLPLSEIGSTLLQIFHSPGKSH